MKNDSGYKLFWFLFIWIVGTLVTYGMTILKMEAAGFDEALYLVFTFIFWPILLGIELS